MTQKQSFVSDLLSLASAPSKSQLSAKIDQILTSLKSEEADALLYDWGFWARPDQLPPGGDWLFWLMLAGRGSGKTRAGAEWVAQRVRHGARWIGLIGQTVGDVRDVMVEGPAGIMAVHHPNERPMYEPSKRRLSWPNGAQASTFSGDSPDQLRGPQFDTVWADEPAKWKYPTRAWDNMELGLRLGDDPRGCATTTPRAIPLIRRLVADPDVHLTRASTYANLGNLAPRFIQRVLKRYEHTRLGRQELYAELLDDVAGALWTREMLDRHRVDRAPALRRIAVGVDPQGKKDATRQAREAIEGDENENPQGLTETGVIVSGEAADGEMYVLDDQSGYYSPKEWGEAVVQTYHDHRADWVVAEANYGGDMVAHTVNVVDKNVNVQLVHATRGKTVRAAPVVALYEQGRVHHVGQYPELEDEQCTWVDEPGQLSPNRMDALVWSIWKLQMEDDERVGYDRGRHMR